MRRTALIAALGMVASVAWAAPPALVGKVVPPYPDGLKSNTGSCVGSDTDPKDVCARSIATLDDARDRTLQLLAAEFVDRVGDEPRWRITDAIAYPVLRADELVAIATCQRAGVDDVSVVAIIDVGGEGTAGLDMLPAVRWAVRLDRATGKFLRVSPAQVRCYNEGTSE